MWVRNIYCSLLAASSLSTNLSKISVLRTNKSTACRCPRLAVGCLIEDKKSKSKRGNNSENKMHFELSPLIVWIALWIVNTFAEFQVNIFSGNRDIAKWQSFCTMTTTTTPKVRQYLAGVFSENSRPNNRRSLIKGLTPLPWESFFLLNRTLFKSVFSIVV